MNINWDFNVKKVLVDTKIEGFDKVIKVVEWEIVFKLGEFSAVFESRTKLNINEITHYLPYKEIDGAILKDWCIEASGGQAFFNKLSEKYISELLEQKQESELEVLYDSSEI